MDGLNLDGIIDGSPERAAAMIVGIYRTKVGGGVSVKLPFDEVMAVERALARAAHQAHEQYGDVFVVEMRALHPELCGKCFSQPPAYQLHH